MAGWYQSPYTGQFLNSAAQAGRSMLDAAKSSADMRAQAGQYVSNVGELAGNLIRDIESKREAKQKEDAMRNALVATANPDQAQNLAYSPEERAGIEESLRVLRETAPGDVAGTEAAVQTNAMEQLYSKPGVDLTKVKSFENTLYKNKASRPGTDEYKALRGEELGLYEDKKKIDDKYRVSKDEELGLYEGKKKIDTKYRTSRDEELGLYEGKKKIDAKYRAPSASSVNKAYDVKALAQYANDLGVQIHPYDNAKSLEYKIKNKQKAFETANRLEKEQTKADEKTKKTLGPLLGEVDTDTFSNKIKIPLDSKWFTPDDSTRLSSFIKDPYVEKAIRTQNLRPKNVEDLLILQIKAGDDVENALEKVAKRLTGRSLDF